MVWFCGENGLVSYDSKGVDDGCKWRAGTGYTEVRLGVALCSKGMMVEEGRWWDDGFTMRERWEGVESPGAYVDD